MTKLIIFLLLVTLCAGVLSLPANSTWNSTDPQCADRISDLEKKVERLEKYKSLSKVIIESVLDFVKEHIANEDSEL
jgi:hypothetical protein